MTAAPTGRGERGSLVIAMAIVLVLSGLSIAALARTVSAVGSARVAQDSASAAAAADAGITDALSALDAAVPTIGPPFPVIVGPGVGAIGAASFHWTASVPDAATATIHSVGSANGRQRQVDATASRSARWPWTIATSGSLVLEGRSSISGRLAAAGPLVLRAGASGGTSQDLLGPGAGCTGCPAPNLLAAPFTFTAATIPTSPSPLPCPASPVSELAAGTYLCVADITFDADVRLRGPVVIYQENGADGLGAPTAIRFSSAEINEDGPAGDLVIHKIGAGVVDPGTATLGAIVDAPAATLASGSCRFHFHGAMVLGSFSCSSAGGGPTLSYDAGSFLSPSWVVGVRRDVPVGTT